MQNYFDFASYYPAAEFLQALPPAASVSQKHFSALKTAGRTEQIRYKVAQLINADNRRIFFVNSAAYAFELAVNNLIEHEHLEEIIVPECIPPYYLPLIKTFDKRGLNVKKFASADELKSHGRTLLLLPNPLPDGKLFPIAKTIEKARQLKVKTFLDLSLSILIYAFDTEKLQPDFVVFDSKFLPSISGTAPLFIHPKHKAAVYSGYGSGEYGTIAGEPNYESILHLEHAIEMITNKRHELLERFKNFTQALTESLNQNWQITLHNKQAPNIIALKHKNIPTDEVIMHLDLAGIQAGEIVCNDKLVRISFGIETTAQELDLLTKALNEL